MKAQIITFALVALTFMSCTSANQKVSGDTQNSQPNMNDENQIVGKQWKLIKLEGQDIKRVENQGMDIFFTLEKDENRINGFSGCNNVTGIYKLEEGNRIRFSKMASTLKACPDVDINESDFMKVFELADNYTLNGNTLSLNVGKRAPLAVFEALEP